MSEQEGRVLLLDDSELVGVQWVDIVSYRALRDALLAQRREVDRLCVLLTWERMGETRMERPAAWLKMSMDEAAEYRYEMCERGCRIIGQAAIEQAPPSEEVGK